MYVYDGRSRLSGGPQGLYGGASQGWMGGVTEECRVGIVATGYFCTLAASSLPDPVIYFTGQLHEIVSTGLLLTKVAIVCRL